MNYGERKYIMKLVNTINIGFCCLFHELEQGGINFLNKYNFKEKVDLTPALKVGNTK